MASRWVGCQLQFIQLPTSFLNVQTRLLISMSTVPMKSLKTWDLGFLQIKVGFQATQPI